MSAMAAGSGHLRTKSIWLALPLGSLKWMGWGMAVCSLEGTHAILLCCLVPEVLLWGIVLVGGTSLGNDTVLPQGPCAETLRGPS